MELANRKLLEEIFVETGDQDKEYREERRAMVQADPEACLLSLLKEVKKMMERPMFGRHTFQFAAAREYVQKAKRELKEVHTNR